jgi:hypothetical protein
MNEIDQIQKRNPHNPDILPNPAIYFGTTLYLSVDEHASNLSRHNRRSWNITIEPIPVRRTSESDGSYHLDVEDM